ncbi:MULTISPECIES: DNA gyrase inhibitor YacG [unclassified Sphingomonas]|uniref:DNA gyrase inhibitor YacG n=1 Tax=Sphingomonas TaxID=13687 RepID=UPI00095A7E70|nr:MULTISPECIES: DNA gyrase inhibitor YacG [unclassified Sphingomonas]MBN8812198.1 DNA gyrase inhibitor YacG [Sphingomonas sp.]OJY47913.1 MAG: DNA gyrase inhibitor YacG [Sphingomonas sp. 67-41]
MAKSDTCPVCGQPTDIDNKPFCSRGCKDRDLLQWLGEGYRIPGERVDPHAHSGVDSTDSRD